MANFKFKIVKHIGDLRTQSSGWIKELNIVAWNDAKPKFDIRDWSPDHKACGKGITFDDEEAQLLMQYLQKQFE